jgi:hypothetical protein
MANDFVSIETNGDSTRKAEFVRGVRPPEHPAPSPFMYHFNVAQLDKDCAVVTYQVRMKAERHGGANNSAGDPSCIGSGFLQPNAAHNPRILQLALKFIF